MIVFYAENFSKDSFKINFPTCTSTALKRSSSKRMSLSEYNDLAKEILAF